ncbi:MAG: sensor histidine kinase, partial [Putridiphycobacter sp.]|nr:sensor histidine kinase [Putridiphycobacter sp.]
TNDVSLSALLDSAERYTTFIAADQAKAQTYYDTAFELVKGSSDQNALADFYFRKSKLAMYSGNTIEGEALCNLALEAIKDEGISILFFHIKHRLGNAYYMDYKYNRAIKEYLDIIYLSKVSTGFTTAELQELKAIEAYSYNNIAGINYILFAEENAIEYYKKSAALFRELGDESMLKYCYFSIASAYVDKRDYAQAKENLDTGFALVDYNDKNIALGDFYLTNSYYLLETGALDSAKLFIDLAREIFVNYEDDISINKADIFIGSYLHYKKQYAKSIQVLEAGYEKLNHDYSDRLLLRTELLLAENYEKTGNYYKAHKFLQKALVSHDKILHNHEEFFTFELENRLKVNQDFYLDSINTISNNLKIEKIKSDLKDKSNLNRYLLTAVGVFIIAIVGLFVIVRRIRIINKQLKKSISENNVLFKEVHHRVKNNFQIISSLINLQKMAVDKPEVDRILSETQQRINSMSLVHELLYQHDEVDKINISEYVSELVVSIEKSYINVQKAIAFHINMNQIELVLEKAIPLGLILSEAITNAIKHAFKDKDSGDIWIALKSLNPSYYQLTVRDNGVGFVKDKVKRDGKSLGFDLIEILSEQLDGTCEFSNHDGFLVTITFKK